MTSPDSAWEEDSPFDEMPPQLSFVRRWHADFLDLGEKILFKSGSRNSEQINMIKQGFFELDGENKVEACRIIRVPLNCRVVSISGPN